MLIRPADSKDEYRLSLLISEFRVELERPKGAEPQADIEAGRREFREYLEKGYPMFVAENETQDLIGYLVCRIEDNIVWAESLFVLPECRRKGVASRLYDKAEELARELGEDTVYNWVHPNNHRIISFLAKRGYDVLNLIEIRKPLQNEKLTKKIKVGEYEYRY